LDEGVLIKFDPALTESSVMGLYAWRLVQTDPVRFWQVFRDARTDTNRWIININLAGCVTNTILPQPPEEDLFDDILIEVPAFFGVCDDDQPILNLRAQMFPTMIAAQMSWPNLQIWDWPPY
jgi:hypothetical protein